MNDRPDKMILTVGDLLSAAQTQPMDSAGEDAADRLQEARLMEARARRDEEWSLLANQVVGGETGIFPEPRVAYSAEQSEAPKTAGAEDSSTHCCGP